MSKQLHTHPSPNPALTLNFSSVNRSWEEWVHSRSGTGIDPGTVLGVNTYTAAISVTR